MGENNRRNVRDKTDITELNGSSTSLQPKFPMCFFFWAFIFIFLKKREET